MEATFPIRFGKYVLLERLGSGGMSEVFRAKAVGLEGFARTVAIKRVLPRMAERADFIRMFIDEAKISASLHHPNICQIYDFGRVGDSHFLAMEYVAGQSLRSLQRRFRKQRKRIPLPVVLYLMNALLDALDYAHKLTDANSRPLGIVHRDVKPQNIIIGYQGHVKLIDFGIAKAASRLSMTDGMGVKGTWCYMAPEQIRHGGVDNRTDIFSASLVLHELLTGRRVYPKGSDPGIVELVRNADIKPPSQLRDRISRNLDGIVMRGLTRDPDDRFTTAGRMRRALASFESSTGRHWRQQDVATMMRKVFAGELQGEEERTNRFLRLEIPDPTDETIEISELDALPAPERDGSASSTSDSLADIESLETGSYSPPPPLHSPAQRPSRWRRAVLLLSISMLVIISASVAGVLIRYLRQRAVRSSPPQRQKAVRASVVTKPLAHEVTIRSEPPGAAVQLIADGQALTLPRDSAPVTLSGLVDGKKYRLRVSRPGHIPVEQEIVWGQQGARVMTVPLNPMPAVAAPPTEPRSPRPGRRRTRRRRPPKRVAVVAPPTVEPTPKPALEPAPPPPPAPKPAPRPKPAPKPKLAPKPIPAPTPPQKPKPVPKPSTGTLVIRSDIPGYVFVDGKNTGRVTPYRARLAVGVHQVVIVLKNRNNTRVKHNVRIKPGKIKALRLKGAM